MTNAIKSIEETKINIIKILEFQDTMLHKATLQANQGSGGMNHKSDSIAEETKNFVSFS